MTPNQIQAEINRQLKKCNARQLDLIFRIVQSLLK